MMKYLFFIFGLFSQFAIFAQVADTTIYSYNDIEVKAKTPLSSAEQWFQSMRNTVKYPEIAIKYQIEGRVTLRFVIEKNGYTSHVEIIGFRSNRADVENIWKKMNKIIKESDPQTELDKSEEALKVAAIEMIKTSAPFIPAQIKGQNVRTSYVVPITFKL